MLEVRLNCPICGIPILAEALEGHLERVHELTGTFTLRLNPTSPFTHQPGPEPESQELEMAPPGGEELGGEEETAQATETQAETETEAEPEPEPKPRRGRKSS